MKLLMLIYKNEMVLFFLIISLFLWGVFSTVLAFQNKTKVILIGKTQNSYQVISDEEKSLIEAQNFIRHFMSLTLNFDQQSYKKHISLAGDLMTESLWKKKKSEFTEMADVIKQHKVIQSSEILSMKKQKTNSYEIKIRNYLVKNGVLTETDKSILISLIQNNRSYENPWRYSVSEVKVK